jgi:hypothetical protein
MLHWSTKVCYAGGQRLRPEECCYCIKEKCFLGGWKNAMMLVDEEMLWRSKIAMKEHIGMLHRPTDGGR